MIGAMTRRPTDGHFSQICPWPGSERQPHENQLTYEEMKRMVGLHTKLLVKICGLWDLLRDKQVFNVGGVDGGMISTQDVGTVLEELVGINIRVAANVRSGGSAQEVKSRHWRKAN